MWYAATAVPVDGSALPVALSVAKSRLRIDFEADDDLLSSMIEEATAHVERYCNIRLRRQVLTCRCNTFADFVRLPDGPLSAGAIQSITYFDTAGDEQTLEPTRYSLWVDGLESSIVPKPGTAFPRSKFGELITVTMVAGYDVLPADLRDAILLRVVTRYRNPENAAVDGWSEMDSMLVNFRRGA